MKVMIVVGDGGLGSRSEMLKTRMEDVGYEVSVVGLKDLSIQGESFDAAIVDEMVDVYGFRNNGESLLFCESIPLLNDTFTYWDPLPYKSNRKAKPYYRKGERW